MFNPKYLSIYLSISAKIVFAVLVSIFVWVLDSCTEALLTSAVLVGASFALFPLSDFKNRRILALRDIQISFFQDTMFTLLCAIAWVGTMVLFLMTEVRI